MSATTYHDSFAGPVLFVFFNEGVGYDDDGIADKSQSSSERDPFENSFLRLRDIIVGRLLDKIASGVSCGQGLSPRAGGGGLGDINIRISGGDAADGEGDQEEAQ